MTNMLFESAFFGVVISLLAYELGMLLKKKFGLPLFNPLLISIADSSSILHRHYNSDNRYRKQQGIQ